jgi:hypothetical protein
MKYTQILLIVVLILSGKPTWSQEKFRPGFIITAQQDTINGFIRYKSDQTASVSCHFMKTTEDEAKEYLPTTINAYGFQEGKFYISKTVMQEGKPTAVFLEFLIRGAVNIYSLTDNTGPRYFAETGKDGLIELSEPERVVRTDSGNFFVNSKYRGKLRVIMSSHPEIQPSIEKTTLQPKQLIRLAKEYHQLACPDETCIVFERNFKPVTAGFSLGGGITLRKLNLANKLVTDYEAGYNTVFNVSVKNLFSSDERFSLETGIGYSSNNKFTFRNSEAENQSQKVTYSGKVYYINPFEDRYISDLFIKVTKMEVETRYSLLTIPLSLKYTLNTGKIRPSAGIGGVISFVSSQNKDLHYHYFSDALGNTFPSRVGGLLLQLSADFKTGNAGFVGLGLKYLYESNFGNPNEFLVMNSLHFNLTYTFR